MWLVSFPKICPWSGLQYQVDLSTYEPGLNSNQKVVGYLIAIAHMGWSCHTGQYFSSQSSPFPDIIDDILPTTTTSNICPYHENYQQRSFLVSTILISPCAFIKVCGVFSTRDLPSSSSGWPRVMAIICTASLGPNGPTVQLEVTSHTWHWAFYFSTHCFWEELYLL